MTNIRLPSRQRNIRIPILMSAALHVAVVATLVLIAAEPSLPRLLKAEVPALSVSWISVVPAGNETPAVHAEGKAAPVPESPVPAPRAVIPEKPVEKEAGREAQGAGSRNVLLAATTSALISRSPGQVSSASAALPSRGATAGEVMTAALPRYRSNARPSYPLAARLRGYEGVVLLSVEVSAEGRVDDLKVKRSSGYDVLDRSALEAVLTWTFEPARRMGRPVRIQVDVPVKFLLRSEESLS